MQLKQRSGSGLEKRFAVSLTASLQPIKILSHNNRESIMATTYNGKLNRACNKRGRSAAKASNLANTFLRFVTRDDNRKEASAEFAADMKAVDDTCREADNEVRGTDRTIRVWRRED